MDLAKKPTEDTGYRDAFHVPTVVANCYSEVKPGDSVRFVYEDGIEYGLERVEKCDLKDRHAIVNPFHPVAELDGCIPKYEKFFAILTPNRTTRLGHHFDIEVDGAVSTYEDAVGADGSFHDDGCRGCA